VDVSIKFEKEKFNLIFKKKLSNSIRFQIEYYGFKSETESLLVFKAQKKSIAIAELIKYLESNNFIVGLCHESKKILEIITTNNKDFTNKFNELKLIKDNLDSNDYINFFKNINYLKRELKDHQKKSFFHLCKAKCAANFSVPGSGKTAVVLAFYEKLKLENKVDALFVIGPRNCYHSWNTEFNLTLNRNPKLKILDESQQQRKKIYETHLTSELYACHFATLTNDIEYLQKFLLNKNFLIVIDEAHNIKKIGGKWSNAILKLGNLSEYKVILTGTPMPQDFKDFYNYLDFLYEKNEIISSYEKAQIEVFMENKKFDEATVLINSKIYPFFSRVTKKQLNLSKPNFLKPYYIKMNPIEDKIHQAIITKIRFFSKKDYLKKKNLNLIRSIQKARMIRLRQTCSYVRNLITAIPEDIKQGDENLLEGEDLQSLISTYDLKEKPAKLLKLKSIVINLIKNNKKVIIWSTFLKTIELIKKELESEKINIKEITGKTKLEDRENIKDEFNDNSSKLEVIIANPQACSESISLHKSCQNAIYYDLNYNTAEFLQSLDRIHRVGGSEDNPVYYHFLQYENSIDIKVHKRVFEKADRQMQVIESENLTFSHSDGENWGDLYASLDI
jgi:SNF2 family DNA or RNA helicase